MPATPPGAPSRVDYALMALDAYDYRADPGDAGSPAPADPDFAGRAPDWVHLPATGDYGPRNATQAFGNGLEYNVYRNAAEAQLVIAFRGTEFTQAVEAVAGLRFGLFDEAAYDRDLASLLGYWQDGGATVEAEIARSGDLDDFLADTLGLSQGLAEAVELVVAVIDGPFGDGTGALVDFGEATVRSMARQAIASVLEVAAANPGFAVTVTGHSLGGALSAYAAAALGVPAVAFDPAPYGATAFLGELRAFADELIAAEYPDLDTAALGWQRGGGAAQTAADRVDETRLEGSFVPDLYLTADPGDLPAGAGAVEVIGLAAEGVTPLELHSMDLLALVLASRSRGAASLESLADAVPGLLAAMHEGAAVSPGDDDPNTFFRTLIVEDGFYALFAEAVRAAEGAAEAIAGAAPTGAELEAELVARGLAGLGGIVAAGTAGAGQTVADVFSGLDGTDGDDTLIGADGRAETFRPGLGRDVVVTGGGIGAGDTVAGTLAELDGDVLAGFDFEDRVIVEGATVTDFFILESFPLQLELLAESGERARFTLPRDPDIGEIVVEPVDEGTQVTLRPQGVLDAAAVATVALIYEAGLGRMADPTGLNFWVDRREDGLSENGLARAFLDSPEFRMRVGDPSELADRAFVEGLYDNVLGRAGDPGGVAFWTGLLAEGAGRAPLLKAFAESPENRAAAEGIDDLAELAPGYWDFA